LPRVCYYQELFYNITFARLTNDEDTASITTNTSSQNYGDGSPVTQEFVDNIKTSSYYTVSVNFWISVENDEILNQIVQENYTFCKFLLYYLPSIPLYIPVFPLHTNAQHPAGWFYFLYYCYTALRPRETLIYILYMYIDHATEASGCDCVLITESFVSTQISISVVLKSSINLSDWLITDFLHYNSFYCCLLWITFTVHFAHYKCLRQVLQSTTVVSWYGWLGNAGLNFTFLCILNWPH